MESDEVTPAPAGFGPAPAGASAPVLPAAPRRFGRRARIATLAVIIVAALETDNVMLTMKPGKGSALNGGWRTWTGTLVVKAPPVTITGGACTARTWTFAVTSR